MSHAAGDVPVRIRKGCKLSICIALPPICGSWFASYIPKLHPNDEAGQNRWVLSQQNESARRQGRSKNSVSGFRSIDKSNTEVGGRRSELRPSSFEKNAERMGYPEFRRQHLFIGTGVIEGRPAKP